ncbi:hematopoietic SH2 domain-containing protein homolog [Latimeria chalumnae]|uniref:hematopoietic SH2 domain-containing protein homolog n=1 Tax=Latimeria chalumnae TaxID=7897 RepID=UPI0003C1612A|nr:PREDICTED: uncharacterized protein LOC102348034 [Latimeria chalumnae]XP_014340418.1 PREDICTED: uncharacterized protein LOC102348034 [Latimeria chalumnae]|eukprot:XP_005989944.1 PREDICTED: uncharacterized protein LOC102348034 [Latimeria chalumnae]
MGTPAAGVTRAAAIRWFTDTQVQWIIQDGIPEWFHGIITRKDAEDLLLPKPLGCYLIRVSESRIGYSLSYRAPDRCRHFMVDMLKSGQYGISGETKEHQTLQDLVDFHRRVPITSFNELLTIPCGQKNNSETDYEELLFTSKQEPPAPTSKSEGHRKLPHLPQSLSVDGMNCFPRTNPVPKPRTISVDIPVRPAADFREETAPPLPLRSILIGSETTFSPRPRVPSPVEHTEKNTNRLYPSLSDALKTIDIQKQTLTLLLKPIPNLRENKLKKCQNVDNLEDVSSEQADIKVSMTNRQSRKFQHQISAYETGNVYTDTDGRNVWVDEREGNAMSALKPPAVLVRSTSESKPLPRLKNLKGKFLPKKRLNEPLYSEVLPHSPDAANEVTPQLCQVGPNRVSRSGGVSNSSLNDQKIYSLLKDPVSAEGHQGDGVAPCSAADLKAIPPCSSLPNHNVYQYNLTPECPSAHDASSKELVYATVPYKPKLNSMLPTPCEKEKENAVAGPSCVLEEYLLPPPFAPGY